MAEGVAAKRPPVIRVSHPGVPGSMELSGSEVADKVEAVKAFRKKHGRIETVHPYTVTVEKDGVSKEFQVSLSDVEPPKNDEKAKKTGRK